MKADLKTSELLLEQSEVIVARARDDVFVKIEDVKEFYGAEASDLWSDHLMERVRELAAAISVGDPDIFHNQIEWVSTVVKSRNLRAQDLKTSMSCLRSAISETLLDGARVSVLEVVDSAAPLEIDQSASSLDSFLDPAAQYDSLALQFIQTVISGNVSQGIEIILDAYDEGISVEQIYLNVLLPGLREVGRLWHLNKLSVAEEHLVSNTTERIMAVLASKVEAAPDTGKTVLLGSVSGNAHNIAIRAISYLLEFRGWRVIYLGSDTPTKDIASGVQVYRPAIVMLSAGLSTHFRMLQKTIDQIKNTQGIAPQIIVGGNAFMSAPNAWRDLGADDYAKNIEEALNSCQEVLKT